MLSDTEFWQFISLMSLAFVCVPIGFVIGGVIGFCAAGVEWIYLAASRRLSDD